MKRYAIWNKSDAIIKPNGEVLTPEQWIAEHPSFGLDNITVVIENCEVNGGFYLTLSQFVKRFEELGCDFTGCETAEEKLEAVDAFLDAREVAEAQAIAEERVNAAVQADALASIAASLEYQNLMTLPDVEE